MRWFVVVLLAAQVASAEPGKEVTRAFQAGVDAFRLGKHDEARAQLERARQLSPRLPGPHRFLAAVAQAQGRFADCIAAARRAIELNPTSAEVADTRKLHDDCRRADGRPAYAQPLGDQAAIGVTSNITGATVTISGLVYGGTPMAPRPIPAGTHTVELTRTGYLPATLRVDALAGIVTDVEIELAPVPRAGETSSPRATASLALAVPASGATIRIDGTQVTPTVEAGRESIAVVPGIRVLDVRVPGKDPWRRRIEVPAHGGVRGIVAPELVDTAERERIRTKGLWLTGTGVGFTVVGAVSLGIGAGRDSAGSRRVFYGVGGGALGLGAVLAVLGVLDLHRGQRPDLTAPPPFVVVPVEGGALASTGLAF